MARHSQTSPSAVFLRLVAFLTLVLGGVLSGAGQAHAIAPACAASPIVCENQNTGNPSTDWDVSGIGDPSLQGFATDISVNKGQTVSFKIQTDAAAYSITIYRLGYYGGNGARQVATIEPSVVLPQSQPACLSDSNTGLVDCGNWAVSASWTTPTDAVSGVYIARLVRADTGGASHIAFIVRDDASHSALLFQTSDTTWQAYNDYGGNSLYVGSPAGRAYKVSYNRPFYTRTAMNGLADMTWVFGAEYPMIRWLESNGYDVTYTTGADSDRRGNLIQNHKTFLSVGHDEYWSGPQRANVEAARAAGVNLAFFSGNESFWKTRWENSIDGSGTPYRTLVSYKETKANAVIDPADPPTWTGTWRDPRFSPPADGGRPENALSGTIFAVNCCPFLALTVPAADGKMRLWRNTTVATLPPGQSATLSDTVVGHEVDIDADNGSRPPGTIRLSSTTVAGFDTLVDYGNTFAPGTVIHHLTLYRHASGALVFGAGTIQWSWGLDNNHDHVASTVDVSMQQATVNLLADMGAQPTTLQPGLVGATSSTDHTAPTSHIDSPTNGSSVQSGKPTTVSGTAVDTGGGVVGGVEISVDGGTRWHPVDGGRESWTYTWTPTTLGTVTVKTRATDDSGNIENPGSGITVNVTPPTCPCTVYNGTGTPANPSANDGQPIEVGVKFRSDVAGYVNGVRFYKGTGNGGSHVGYLYSLSGTVLASAGFGTETPSGWQEVTFASPVAIAANTTYIAAYYSPGGGYAATPSGLISGVDASPLHLLSDSAAGGNGVYRYGGPGVPNLSYNAGNYWVDLVFNTAMVDTVPPSVTTKSPAAGAVASPGVVVSATFNKPVAQATISFVLKDGSNATVPAAIGYTASTNTATLTPNAPLAGGAYTVNLSGAKDAAGNTMAPLSWSFTVPTCPCTIFNGSGTPANPSANDGRAIELGLKFRSDSSGYISGVSFYKGSANTGPHVGNLYSTNGTLLASAPFSNETPSGWQSVSFSSPVQISANTTYVATYYSPSGGYAATGNAFSPSGVDSGNLHALANGVDGPNGLYSYGATGLPTQSYNSANYWVDVTYVPTLAMIPPTVTAHTPASGAVVGPAATLSATFNKAVTPSSISFVLKDASNATVAATTAYDASTTTASLRPSANLAGGAYTATVSGAADSGGNVMTPVSWTFSVTSCPCSAFTGTSTPVNPYVNDNQALEVGVKLRADTAGFINGIRFYKGTGNSGAHVGNLYSATGTLLASASFSNETPSGWQTVMFATPVQVTANTTYVAAYFSPAGGYASTPGAFASAGVDNGPLHELANGVDGPNGVYKYGGGFPTSSYNASNYWVDVIYTLTSP